MTQSRPPRLAQNLQPGRQILRFRGDLLTIELEIANAVPGKAFVRTNLGQAARTRREIVRLHRYQEPRLGRDWFDWAMAATGEGHFQLVMPLREVGHFEFKAYFLPDDEGEPLWPQGSNVEVNVLPADNCCANTIYNVFVRQFGPNKTRSQSQIDPHLQAPIETLDKSGYTVIPPSGTFRDLIKELDFIIDELGCRYLQLLPVHPIPTTYARMGRFGSPYAALSFTQVDPGLAEFDQHATPLEQFAELVDAVHARQARLILDIAINHTGWAASLHESHPEWLARDPSGRISEPGAWGVVWADLTELDYRHKGLWEYMADVFLTWCRRGVDGFRCDAGYMIPVEAWEYIIARVRAQYADTIFLLEGLGGPIAVTRALLNRATFDWAYSELFQNYDRAAITRYHTGAKEISQSAGLTIHFAETHDNNRLAATSATYARMRTALCALLSFNGGFAFANGVEWLATEKINVHEACGLNWGAPANQVAAIQRLTWLLAHHPSFHDGVQLHFVHCGEHSSLALDRHHPASGARVLVVVNLDDRYAQSCCWPENQTGLAHAAAYDLLTDQAVALEDRGQGQIGLVLQPGQVLCLATARFEASGHDEGIPAQRLLPPRLQLQRLKAKIFDLLNALGVEADWSQVDLSRQARLLTKDPVEFCRRWNPDGSEARLVFWHWPRDSRRQVMVPPGFLLCVRAPRPFRARLVKDRHCLAQEESFRAAHDEHFALLIPGELPSGGVNYQLQIAVYNEGSAEHIQAPVRLLPTPEQIRLQHRFLMRDISADAPTVLATNGKGGMSRAGVYWGRLYNRYDALLAANLHPQVPVDRWIMLSRCRAWLVCQDYSQAVNTDCMHSFTLNDQGGGHWRFRVPTGVGRHIDLQITLWMPPLRNAVCLTFRRMSINNSAQVLDPKRSVKLIIRPDIENRGFHEQTKAYAGPEQHWPSAIRPRPNGFDFRPDRYHRLQLEVDNGRYIHEPEWQYMVHRVQDAERGFDPDGDLFSPGYFETHLADDEQVVLSASISDPQQSVTKTELDELSCTAVPAPRIDDSLAALVRRLDQYVVQRGEMQTVIAGYPWFLDWGRDALIACRGLIAAGRYDTVTGIIQQFASLECDGTLPNMLHGENDANRDTSDAPLWLLIACRDLMAARDDGQLLEMTCGQRRLREVLTDMARALTTGAANGVRMDPQSGLLFSPEHYTWMDTAHPAGTPRQGYAVEIQALWYAGLSFLAAIDDDRRSADWIRLSLQVQQSLEKLFWLDQQGYLADCLHASSGQAAKDAAVDDAMRPNQLLAITMGAFADGVRCQRLLENCMQLIVPGAIRSLADRPLKYPLPVYHQGRLLNDPHRPYQGHYTGDEDSSRKPAYHNGTAWGWMFPSFCEAWYCCFAPAGQQTALAWLLSSIELLHGGCIGHLPEIVDGDYPHTPRGCDAQAWSLSELLRVWQLLSAQQRGHH
jgi:predicted glycogen debranching enzyme